MVFDRKSIPIVACKQNQQDTEDNSTTKHLQAIKNKTIYETHQKSLLNCQTVATFNAYLTAAAQNK